MDSILRAIADARASATAAVRALKRSLPAGWVFQINAQQRAHAAPGTVSGTYFTSSRDLRSRFDADARDQGKVSLHGNTVRWWRLARQYQIPDVDPISDRRLRDLLRAAISRTYPADDSRRVEQSLNGKVGGGTREMAGRRAEEIYASLHYRVETSEYRAILEDEDFGRWLAMKSRKVADNRSRV